MIYIRTAAYNAEDTLARTIESVLGQTYSDFIYYLMDNGSKDGTKEIIMEYAAKDKRIVPFYNIINHNYTENISFWDLPHHIPEGDYLCFLDADDWYESNFLEEMLSFAQQNKLDIAACGTWFIDSETEKISGKRVLPHDVILKEPTDYENYFDAVYWHFRQIWGKLYSSKAADHSYDVGMPEWYPRVYGRDTAFVLTCSLDAGMIGVRAKHLHNYWVHATSNSYQWDDGRIYSDVILFEKGKEFLKQKCGSVSKKNHYLLLSVYYYAVCDTMNVLMKSLLPIKEKISNMDKILKHQYTIEALATDMSENGISRDAKNNTLDYFISKSLLACNGKQRLKVLQLAQMVFAVLGAESLYILYSKQLIDHYIKNGYYSQARIELDEWEVLLPGDGELAGYRKKLII